MSTWTIYVRRDIKDSLTSNDLLKNFLDGLDALSMYEWLENAKFGIEDNCILINKLFYDKLFDFCEVKPNAKTEIKIYKLKTIEDNQKFNYYKMLFDKWKHWILKLNIKLMLFE